MEDHLFKWIDEALLDETRKVEAKHLKLVEDVKALRTIVAKMEEDITETVAEKIKTDLDEMVREMVKKTILKYMGLALVVLGMAWLCEKF